MNKLKKGEIEIARSTKFYQPLRIELSVFFFLVCLSELFFFWVVWYMSHRLGNPACKYDLLLSLSVGSRVFVAVYICRQTFSTKKEKGLLCGQYDLTSLSDAPRKHYKHSAIHWIVIYPVDSFGYPLNNQPGQMLA